jgi:tetratricopeptide (TPR) repeat protein
VNSHLQMLSAEKAIAAMAASEQAERALGGGGGGGGGGSGGGTPSAPFERMAEHGQPLSAPLGLSLAAWDALIADYPGGRAAFEDKTTDWVKHHVIIPRTALPTAPSHALTCSPATCVLPGMVPAAPAPSPLEGGGASACAAHGPPPALAFCEHPSACVAGGSCGESYVEQQRKAGKVDSDGTPHVGPCNVFISHAYTYRFLTVLETVREWERQQRAKGVAGPFYYYFDLFQNNQHVRVGDKVTFEVLSSKFGENVKAIKQTLLVLDWEKPEQVLGRAWCVFEIWTTVMVGAKFAIALSAEDRLNFLTALVEDYESLVYKTSGVDVFLADAREPEDLESIRRVLRESGKILETNQLVIGAMRGWMALEAKAFSELARSQGRNDDKVAAQVIVMQGRFLMDQGKRGEAELLFREVLATHRGRLGNMPLDGVSLDYMVLLANNLRVQGKLLEAEPIYSKALLACKKLETENGRRLTLVCMEGFASLLHTQDRLEEAEPLFRDALNGFKTFGDQHLNLLSCMNNFSRLLKDQGKLDEAMELLNQVIKIRESTPGGNNHPRTLISKKNKADLLSAQGKLPEAEELFRAVLDISERTLGYSDPFTLECMSSLASLLEKKGKTEEAKQLIETLTCNFSTLLLEDGRDGAARREWFFRADLFQQRRKKGDTHPDTLECINTLAGEMYSQGELAKAEPLFREALSIQLGALGDKHPTTLLYKFNLSRLLMERKKPAEAFELRDFIFRTCQHMPPAGRPFDFSIASEARREARVAVDEEAARKKTADAPDHPDDVLLRLDISTRGGGAGGGKRCSGKKGVYKK